MESVKAILQFKMTVVQNMINKKPTYVLFRCLLQQRFLQSMHYSKYRYILRENNMNVVYMKT